MGARKACRGWVTATSISYPVHSRFGKLGRHELGESTALPVGNTGQTQLHCVLQENTTTSQQILHGCTLSRLLLLSSFILHSKEVGCQFRVLFSNSLSNSVQSAICLEFLEETTYRKSQVYMAKLY